MDLDIKSLSNEFLDIVFPRNCIITGEAVQADSPFKFISKTSAEKVFRVEPPHCHTCGFPYFGAVIGKKPPQLPIYVGHGTENGGQADVVGLLRFET